ncbi:MAG: site-specific integrase, partial [Deltaproteobacteria bacterium]|nr:site-specific integrase [Deltaproteobacteria bacterium]
MDMRSMDMLKRFLDLLSIEKGLSANTVQAYRHDLETHIAYLKRNGKNPSSAEANDISRYLSLLKGKGLDARTIIRALSAVKGFYRHLQSEKVISASPCAL